MYTMDPLAGERYVSLATFRKTGKAVETPIWFAYSDDRYYAFSEGKAGKVKRLRNSSRARVAACNVRGVVRGEWMDAEAQIVHDADVQRRAYDALRAKYGAQMRITDFFARLSGRIGKRAVLEISLVDSSQ